MECNKDEAKRAMDIAEKKLSENDYVGAKKFLTKAQNLYPNLDGLNQVSMMIHVYITAANKINGGKESDLYGVLGVDPLADDEALKKQYKKLALLLHPDKNKCQGAEGAFKLVLNAWSLLSDKAKRRAYDQRRKLSTGMQKPPAPSQHNKPPPGSSNEDKPAPAPAPAPTPGPVPVNTSKQMFWTICKGCKTRSECRRDLYLNKTMRCQNCGQSNTATERNPWDYYVNNLNRALSIIRQRQQQQWGSSSGAQNQPWESYVTQVNYTLSLVLQRQQEWIAKNQAANNNNNRTTSTSSQYVGSSSKQDTFAMQQVYSTSSLLHKLQQQWSTAAANNNGTTPSVRVHVTPGVNVSSSSPQQQQQCGAQTTSVGGTNYPSSSSMRGSQPGSFVSPGPGVNLYSSSPQQQQWIMSGGQNTSGGGTYYTSSSSGSVLHHHKCSVSVPASSSSGNQAQERSKRGCDDSKERLAAIEMIFKKLKRDVV